MRMRDGIRVLAVAGVFALLSAGSGRAAEAAAREAMLDIQIRLQSPLRIEQMEGIVRLGAIADKAVVADFRIQEYLTAVMNNKMLRPDMRRQAMLSLLQLSRKELLTSSLQDDLRRVIADRKDEFEPRLDAIDLLAELGAGTETGVVAEESRKRAITALGEIAGGNANEEALRAAAYLALGGFPGTQDALLKGLAHPTSGKIRAAAITGLSRYVTLHKISDNRLAFQIVTALMGAQTTPEERLAGVECLTALARNGYRIADERVIKFLFDTFAAEKDDALVERVAICLLYTEADQALPVAAAFLKALRSTEGNRSVRVQLTLLKGLDNLVDKFAIQMAEGKDAATVTRAMGAVTDFMGSIATHPNADPKLLDIVITCLGGVPRVFDRETAVAKLIEAMKLHAAKAEPIEMALLQYKRGEPFRDFSDKPDPEAWAAWFEQNRARLKPGLAPYL